MKKFCDKSKHLGYCTTEIKNPTTADEHNEQRLAQLIRRHKKDLLSTTIAEVESLIKLNDLLKEVKAKRDELRIYQPLKGEGLKLKELQRRLELMSKRQPIRVLRRKEKWHNDEITDWWLNAGIVENSHGESIVFSFISCCFWARWWEECPNHLPPQF